MILAGASLTIAFFVIAFWLSGVVPVAVRAVDTGRNAARTLRDPALDDEDKERALQRASLSLMGGFVSIVARAAAALGISVAPALVFEAVGLARFSDIAALLETWEMIIAASVILTALCLVWRRR